MLYGSEVQNDASKEQTLPMVDDEKKERIWEHAWSTDEIRKNSNNWTLAGDVGLLNHLQDFSKKLISRTHEVEKVVDSLIHQSKVAGAKVNNVINDFQMLSNLQFVENRVYDEEVQEVQPEPTKDVQPKTKEQREAEMLPRVKQALELGTSFLDKAFERIEVDETSESEEDDDDDVVHQGRTILEPKDLYEHRPLPYVIGTAEFQTDEYAGLHSTVDDEPSIETTQEENMYSSSSSSSSTSESEDEYLDELPPAKQSTPRKNTIVSVDTMNTKYSDSESSDLFDGGEEENGYVSSSPAEKKPVINDVSNPLMAELMQKTKSVPSAKTEKPESIQSPVVNKKPESEDLFGGGSVEDDDSFFQDEDSPFRKKTGLFSSDGLFGSGTSDVKSDDEGDLFGDAEKPAPVEKKPAPISKVQVLPSPVSKKPISYDDDDGDLFSENKPDSIERKPAPIAKVQVLPSLTKKVANDDDDDDLFDDNVKPKAVEKKPAPVSKVQVLPTAISKALPSKESGAKSVSGRKQPILFGDDDEEDEADDLFSSLSTRSSVSMPKVASDTAKVTQVESSKKSDKSTPSPSISERSNRSLFDAPKETTGSISLFDDGDSDSDDLFGSTKKTATSQKGFSFNFSADVGAADDLFGSKSKQTKPSNISSDEKEPAQKSSSSLFEESDSFDLFKPAASKSKSEDLFVTETKKDTAKVQPVLQDQKKTSALLFEESDSFDLFSPLDKKEPQKPKSEKTEDKPKITDKPKDKEKDILPPVSKNASDISTSAKPNEKPEEKKEPVAAFEDEERKAKKDNAAKAIPDFQSTIENDVAATFDKPSDVGNTLSAINKSRAKIQVKRKKPTRRGRQALMTSDADFKVDQEDTDEASDVTLPSKTNMSPIDSDLFGETEKSQKTEPVPGIQPTNKAASPHKQKEMDKRNLMSQLMFEAQSSKMLKQNTSSVISDGDENDNDDLFSSKFTGSKSSKPLSSDFSVLSPTPKEPQEVDVKASGEIKGPKFDPSSSLLSDSTSDDDLFSASAFKDFKNSLSKSSVFEDDDDIFKSSDNKDNLSRHSSEALGEGNDDIFAGMQKEKYELFPTQVFDDDDDDDDIFSNVISPSSSKKETQKEKPKPSKKNPDDIFEDPLGVA